MEKIKKTIKRKMKIQKKGGDYNITPDLDAVYNIKILLTGKSYDWGSFDIDEIFYRAYNKESGGLRKYSKDDSDLRITGTKN